MLIVYVCKPLVSSSSAGGRLVHSLREDPSPLSDCTRRPPAEKDDTSDLHTYTIYIIDLLKMSG
jgi:hypothetical protein